jgi:hypothetical protein
MVSIVLILHVFFPSIKTTKKHSTQEWMLGLGRGWKTITFFSSSMMSHVRENLFWNPPKFQKFLVMDQSKKLIPLKEF